MIVAYLGLVGMLIFHAILFIVVLSIIRKKFGAKPAIIFFRFNVYCCLPAYIQFGVIIGYWLHLLLY